MSSRATRGYGLLEPFLARQRAKIANRLIPVKLRHGRILDIGCGSHPYFLAHTTFREKFAVDQNKGVGVLDDITWFTLDLNVSPELPFENNFFSVVTMLAVIEHLNPHSLIIIFRECKRVLTPGGVVILTTPAAWSDRLLRLMAKLQLVSKEEIEEHVYTYTLPLLGWYFGSAGFPMQQLQFGYFELGLNLWARARS